MPLILRSSLTRPLTWEEGDGNLTYLNNLVITAQNTADTAKTVTDKLGPAPTGINASYAYTIGADVNTHSWTALGTAAVANLTTAANDTTSGRAWRTNDLVKQTSPSDATAGSVLTVGAGGLLSDAIEDIGAVSWNTLGGNTRFVKGSLSATTDGPFSGAYWLQGQYVARDSSSGTFTGTIVDTNRARAFTRAKSGGSWGTWTEQVTAASPSLKSHVKVIGEGAGDANIATIGFYDADGTTRRGFVGDASSGDSSMYLASDYGPVLLKSQGFVGISVSDTGSQLNGLTTLSGLLRAFSYGSIASAPPVGTVQLEVAASNSAEPAFMAFHRPGQFGAHFGLGEDNQLRLGGWSMGPVSYKILHEGNFDTTDTGSINMTLVNSFEHYATIPLTVRRVGKVVTLSGAFTSATPPAALTQVTTIPVGCRPDRHVRAVGTMYADGLNWNFFDFLVDTNGDTLLLFLGLPTQNNATFSLTVTWMVP